MKKEYIIGLGIALVLLVVIIIVSMQNSKTKKDHRNAMARVAKLIKEGDKNKDKKVKDLFDEITQDEGELDEDELDE